METMRFYTSIFASKDIQKRAQTWRLTQTKEVLGILGYTSSPSIERLGVKKIDLPTLIEPKMISIEEPYSYSIQLGGVNPLNAVAIVPCGGRATFISSGEKAFTLPASSYMKKVARAL